MSSPLLRIKEYIDHKKISISAFEKSINMANASFGKSLKNGGSIGVDKLVNILNVYPDLNSIWVLTGKGEMILNDLEATDQATKLQNQKIISNLNEIVELQKFKIDYYEEEFKKLKQIITELETQLQQKNKSKS